MQRNRARHVRLASLMVFGTVVTLESLAAPLAIAQSADTQAALDSRITARRMAEEAANAYESGQFDAARDLFHRANELYPAPALMLWEARSLEKLGRLVEAEDLYVTVQHYKLHADDNDVARNAIRDAGIEAEQLRKRIPTVTVQLRGVDPSSPSVEVKLNGKRLHTALIGFPVPVDTGERSVALLVGGRELRSQTLTLREGERTTVEFDASSAATQSPVAAATRQEAAPTPSDKTPIQGDALPSARPWYSQRTLGWACVGLGIAGIGTGVTAGLVATKHRDALEGNCSGNACPPSARDDLDDFRRYRTISTIGYTVGGVALAAGLTVLLITPHVSSGRAAASYTLQLTPQSASLTGKF